MEVSNIEYINLCKAIRIISPAIGDTLLSSLILEIDKLLYGLDAYACYLSGIYIILESAKSLPEHKNALIDEVITELTKIKKVQDA